MVRLRLSFVCRKTPAPLNFRGLVAYDRRVESQLPYTDLHAHVSAAMHSPRCPGDWEQKLTLIRFVISGLAPVR
jgi:hypothetical protein